MADELQGKRIAILAADGVERVELEEPQKAVRDAGAETTVLSIQEGEIEAKESDLDDAGTIAVDKLVSDVSAEDFDGLIIPGGTVNPDKLRLDEGAVAFVRAMVESGKPVGAICHGPQVLIAAGVAEGRKLTAFPSVRQDLENAGAEVVDQEVVVDNGLVTSRTPDDLEAFCAKLVEELAEGRH